MTAHFSSLSRCRRHLVKYRAGNEQPMDTLGGSAYDGHTISSPRICRIPRALQEPHPLFSNVLHTCDFGQIIHRVIIINLILISLYHDPFKYAMQTGTPYTCFKSVVLCAGLGDDTNCCTPPPSHDIPFYCWALALFLATSL